MRFSRVPHLVRAERLTEPWTWQTANGDAMVARPGHYRLTDPATGSQWSITPAALAVSYVPVGEGTFESRGDVDARQVPLGDPAVRVTSAEGEGLAEPGDWILGDASGNHWVVKDAWFRERYCELRDPSPSAAASLIDRLKRWLH